MVPDRISRETVIDAPPDVVWAIVTEPRHVARWFSDEAEIDLRPGAAMLLTWHGHGSYRGRVEAVEPPHAFAITPSAEGPRTRLRVVETGFQELTWAEEDTARCADENSEGWVHELTELRDYAAHVAGDRS